MTHCKDADNWGIRKWDRGIVCMLRRRRSDDALERAGALNMSTFEVLGYIG
jgi:hypothetical protein